MLQEIYNNSPYYVQQLLLNIHAARIHKERYGKKFKVILNELDETQYYTPDQIMEYQTNAFLKLINHSYNTVPYYTQLFNSIKLKPSDIKSLDDITKIPILTKETVKDNLHLLISSNFKKSSLYSGGTSGTTGSPLKVLWDQNTCIYTNAIDWRQKKWAGITYGAKVAVILGRPIISTKRTSKPFWQHNYVHNQLWMSSFHLNDINMMHYVTKLNKFKPEAIEGYPSTLYIIASYLNRNNITIPLKAALTSSETLHDFQREAISKAFSCPVFDFYGLAERVVFATECLHHEGKHLNFEYGYTEILDDNDNPVPIGNKGYLVSTSLQNYGLPLIRYKTSDITSFIPETCACGRHMPRIQNISTKVEDIIVTPSGNMISSSSLTHPFKLINGIRKSQIIQDDINNIRLRIVTDSTFNDSDKNVLLDNFKYRVGSDINITVEVLDDIKSEKSGKYRWVISKVPKGQLNINIE